MLGFVRATRKESGDGRDTTSKDTRASPRACRRSTSQNRHRAFKGGARQTRKHPRWGTSRSKAAYDRQALPDGMRSNSDTRAEVEVQMHDFLNNVVILQAWVLVTYSPSSCRRSVRERRVLDACAYLSS